MSQQKVCIVGAGLAGSLMAILLAKLGLHVDIYEKREDPTNFENTAAVDGINSEFGASTSAVKRSINLALSYRGIMALHEVGIVEKVLEHAIKMPRRVIHSIDKPDMEQMYGSKDDTLWSISRQRINDLLLELMRTHGSLIHVYFDHRLLQCDKNGSVSFEAPSGTISKCYDLVIGSDGAYSAVRDNMLRQGRINFSRQYIAHGYKELQIPPRLPASFSSSSPSPPTSALKRVEGLHIWPRGEVMLIALPNPDKSFTATLFAPYAGTNGFDSIDASDSSAVVDYFKRNFPDVVELMPDLVEEYRKNPVGSLVTIRTQPWYFGNTLLIGDAAHAVVPFYGQGMNAAFEDCFLLYQSLKADRANRPAGEQLDFLACIQEFADKRTPSANGLADLCLEHYHDMASNTASSIYLLRRRVENFVGSLLPSVFRPLYSMVAFSNTPYHEAILRSQRQDKWLSRIVSALGTGLLAGCLWSVKFYGENAKGRSMQQ